MNHFIKLKLLILIIFIGLICPLLLCQPDEPPNSIQTRLDFIQKELQELKKQKSIDPALINLIIMTIFFLPFILYYIYSVVDYALI